MAALESLARSSAVAGLGSGELLSPDVMFSPRQKGPAADRLAVSVFGNAHSYLSTYPREEQIYLGFSAYSRCASLRFNESSTAAPFSKFPVPSLPFPRTSPNCASLIDSWHKIVVCARKLHDLLLPESSIIPSLFLCP
ncbi:hypothetical protein PMIN01_06944 [Paraphaeosphaeria minitans]|uniref:Uncharacterized protein n=1 Tax=Paraphaeosphaeria minitans TaxID=565426 RepID=A0A9P6GHL3_9PLEO|nr:hypothetical protein PMIN01_06944 [Paraphaeosphaeria minitans]